MSVSWLAAPTDFLVVICREILPADCSRKYFLCAPDEMLCSFRLSQETWMADGTSGVPMAIRQPTCRLKSISWLAAPTD